MRILVYLTGTRSHELMVKFKDSMDGVSGKYTPFCGLMEFDTEDERTILRVINTLSIRCPQYRLKFCMYEKILDKERALYVPKGSFRNNINTQNYRLL